jgi:N-acetyl-1-D-myo-inositol-2-amino-2-deoxy-alpha-D-glucopyranoside deacetylase
MIVAVVAHPDDESLVAGGTLALAAAAGAETGVVSLTRGEYGPIADPGLATHATLGDVREAELRAAGRVLGVSWTVCLRHQDGGLAGIDYDAAAAELVAVLRPHLPSAVLTFGEDGLYGHPDHVATRRIAGIAVDRLEELDSRTICLYEAAWSAETMPALVAAASAAGLGTDLWGIEAAAFGSPDAAPTIVLDVRDVLAQKLAAVRAHRTQIGPDHLLASLPPELAGRCIDTEPWRLVDRRPEQVDVLAELLVRRTTIAKGAA